MTLNFLFNLLPKEKDPLSFQQQDNGRQTVDANEGRPERHQEVEDAGAGIF